MTQDDSSRLSKFFRGKLPSRERRQFVARVLQDQELYNALAEEQALAEVLQDQKLREEVERIISVPAGLPEPAPRRRSRKLMIWAPVFGLAALLAIIPLLVVRRSKHLEGPIVSTSSSAVPSYRKEVHPNGARPPELAFLLFPSERSGGPMNAFPLPAVPGKIRLELDLGSHRAPSFSAVVEEVGGTAVAEFLQLNAVPVPGGSRHLVIELDSNTLKPANYLIKLYEYGVSANQNIVEGYSFLVEKSKK